MTTDEIIIEPIPDRGVLLLELMQAWWNPPAELISTLPKGGAKLSYLGHADTTRALIETDPLWSWEPMAYDATGLPAVERDTNGNPVGMWIRLTVCGVSRPAYGSCQAGKGEAIKELIGDAIRNGAMRFGVAGALWSKADRSEQAEAKPKRAPASVQVEDAPPPADVFDGRKAFDALVDEVGDKAAVVDYLKTLGKAGTADLTPADIATARAALMMNGQAA